MTDDTSPKNLRKFLESDDSAMVQMGPSMGLSMAKGGKVPDDLLGEILWMYMLHSDKTIRAVAKSTFMKKLARDGATLHSHGLITEQTIAGALGEFGDARAVKPLIKTFESENLDLIKVAAKAIVKIKENDIGDEKENIIKFLESDDQGMVRMGASMLKGILKE